MLKLWGMRSNPSLPLLPGPLCPGVVAPDRVLSMGQIELFNIVVMLAKRKTLGTQKGLTEKHIYSSSRNKIQVKPVKQ